MVASILTFGFVGSGLRVLTDVLWPSNNFRLMFKGFILACNQQEKRANNWYVKTLEKLFRLQRHINEIAPHKTLFEF